MSIKTWKEREPADYKLEYVDRLQGVMQAEIDELRASLAALKHAASALLHQIDIGDFVDSHGHSAKMLKPVHDLLRSMK